MSVRMTEGTQRVLTAMLRDPTSWTYGYALIQTTKMKSGTLYPLLVRLEDRGLVESEWETDVGDAGRPPRRHYRLTPDGVIAAKDAVARMRESLSWTMPLGGQPT